MDILIEYYQKFLLGLSGLVLAAICLIGFARGLDCLGRLPKIRQLFRLLVFPRSLVAWVCTVPLLCFIFAMGAVKPGGGSSTNSPSLSAPLRLLHYIQQAISSNDVERGYRISEDTGDGGIVPMPAGAVTNELLRSRGGYDWAFRIEPGGWWFPYRDGFLDGVTVLARGEVRSDIGSVFFPVPITNGVSLLPEAKWELLPNAGASVFSHAVTDEGSLLLDWHNALVGRDPNCPTNLQIELFRDGSFAWRTDDASQFYLPVFPFDWDNDGLENSVDPEPLVANSVDAHGTNAEWYDIVCSNVFTQVLEPGAVSLQTIDGDEIFFRTNANERAYYFVDAVAELGPAPIFFTADGVSDLGDPIVVAPADVTNRVPLLLGATYSVTSTVPFSVYTPTNEVVEVTTNSPSDYVIRLPRAEWWRVCFPTFSVGEAGMLTYNYIGPMHVSFQGIAVSEIPCDLSDVIPPTGYFTNRVTGLVHGREQGADSAVWIKTGNYWMVDTASSGSAEGDDWAPGTLTWKIPVGWHRKSPLARDVQDISGPDYEVYETATSRPLLIGGRRDLYLQTREILSDGTFRSEKYGHWITRGTWCRIVLDGETIQWFRYH